MKYGVISDIHGNCEALERVLGFLNQEKVERIINCGDIVGYGPRPNECVRKVKNCTEMRSVLGNHDFAVLGMAKLSRFNAAAADSLQWSRQKMVADNIKFLNTLEKIDTESGFLFLHGSPRSPLDEYILGETHAKANFERFKNFLCFAGHTHVPACFRRDSKGNVGSLRLSPGRPVELEEDCRYIFNAGSVGQPRDGDPRACCLIYNTQNRKVQLYRFRYDIEKVQGLMRRQKLADFLIARLARGI